MNIPKELYQLYRICDNPMFEGFALVDAPSLLGRESLSKDLIPRYQVPDEVREWSPARLARRWKPAKVVGRVSPFNDYPCVVTFPAFSRRACDVLRDFLEPNGELLPLDSKVGEYYVFNITTVLDALDTSRAVLEFGGVDYFAFHKEKLKGRSIFRILEEPMMTIVSDAFVRRVHEHGLNGFDFSKIWPLPRGTDWRMWNNKQKAAENRKTAELKQHTLVVILRFKGKKPKAAEKTLFGSLEDQVDAVLAVRTLHSPYFGSYEGHDIVDGEYRMFLSCPDVEALVRKVRPWLEAARKSWPGEVLGLKRYGKMRDKDAREAVVEL
jgi:hypothetical protein